MTTKNLTVSLLIFGAVILGGFFSICREDLLSQKLTSLYQEENKNISEINKNISEKYKPKVGAIKVPILTYHNVRPYFAADTESQRGYIIEPDSFEKQLQYLKDNRYTVISMDTFLDCLLKKSFLPEKPIVLTFDDGWENQYIYAFPILKKFNNTATFFIFSNAPEHKNFMTWDQIKELTDAGMIIGSHSKSHPYFAGMTDKKFLYEEIVDSKKVLEARLGEAVNIFAYPFGQYTPEAISAIRDAGYKAARTIYFGSYHVKDDLYSLESILAPNNFEAFVNILVNR